ncbi:MAG: ABC transporter permease [Eubacteriales bacterium]|nr:ABC transporter permease [Eubacteriales bacterium]
MLNEFLSAISLGLLWTLMTFGVYFSYRILDIADLTAEGSLTMGAAIAAICIVNGVNPFVALLLALIGGMLAGLVTGLLHTVLKIPALLSGILTMIALWSINLRIMGKANIPLLRVDTVFSIFSDLTGISKNYSVLIIGFLFVVAAGLIIYRFLGTEIGCALRATGCNGGMARAQGVNTDLMKILGLMIGNGLIALSGGLIAQSQAFADIQMGTGAIVIGLASLIIGEVLFGRSTVSKAMIAVVAGSVIYRLIIALVLKLGMPANDLKLFTAITVAICLWLPSIRSKLAQRSKKGGRNHA